MEKNRIRDKHPGSATPIGTGTVALGFLKPTVLILNFKKMSMTCDNKFGVDESDGGTPQVPTQPSSTLMVV